MCLWPDTATAHQASNTWRDEEDELMRKSIAFLFFFCYSILDHDSGLKSNLLLTKQTFSLLIASMNKLPTWITQDGKECQIIFTCVIVLSLNIFCFSKNVWNKSASITGVNYYSTTIATYLTLTSTSTANKRLSTLWLKQFYLSLLCCLLNRIAREQATNPIPYNSVLCAFNHKPIARSLVERVKFILVYRISAINQKRLCHGVYCWTIWLGDLYEKLIFLYTRNYFLYASKDIK